MPPQALWWIETEAATWEGGGGDARHHLSHGNGTVQAGASALI